MSQPLIVGDDDFDPMPEAPEAPTDDMCCGSGCDPCIWDTYNAAVQDYRRKRSERLASGGGADYAYGSRELDGHGFALAFTVFTPAGFVGVIDRVVDSVRTAASTGRPSRWIDAQRRLDVAAGAGAL